MSKSLNGLSFPVVLGFVLLLCSAGLTIIAEIGVALIPIIRLQYGTAEVVFLEDELSIAWYGIIIVLFAGAGLIAFGWKHNEA